MAFKSAYILHRYPYRETSFLLKVLTEEEGLITLVARNAKRPKSDWYTLLQPFQKLKLVYQGKGELLNLQQAERSALSPMLKSRTLFAGFYLNELLLKFLAPHDPHQNLFTMYETTLARLDQALEQSLRAFELTMFDELGLLPDLNRDIAGDALMPESWYVLEFNQLPKKISPPLRLLPQHFQGKKLLALQERTFADESELVAAKRFIRLWLEWYGVGRDLKTREIFAEVFAQ